MGVLILIDASKEVGIEVNSEKTKYKLMSRHQNAGQSHNIKIANRSFENVTIFKYLATDPNLIHEEINSRLKSRNARYHLVHNFWLLIWCLKT
jgi:hypothetical protein